ncbi:arsenate reductase ArsC [Rubrobacter taiwanensis]|jgi:arsenate reductase|uniref:Arsenate reductase ArsC n=1 Tax=Rubrobacter taiwanensis TaxID=185139 RepID=A0A4R1BAG9_9ACTN|nr:arsenate reductase ArsC [Rubrobacter taiwanensis]TCJ13943.1 arsenate reductase ArsC [Rubrobacter taiwanensis]
MKRVRVLFLCTGNAARSQMAEAFLREYGGGRYEAYSAGSRPAGEIDPMTVRVMEEIGVDILDQYPKSLHIFLGRKHFGYQITVCKREEERELNCPVFPGMGLRLSWPFEDPRGFRGGEEERLGKFREVRDRIADRVRSWVEASQRV